MAKIEGTQNIPSAVLDAYRATLGEQRPNDIIGKRYPYRVPKMQKGGSGVSPAQRSQRDRFLYNIGLFKTASPAERARWYAAMPPWSSYLWYYNYFMMSGQTGDDASQTGATGVIKSIQVVKDTIPTTGTKSFTIAAVAAAKCIVMIQGSARKVQLIHRGKGSVATGGSTLNLPATIDPDKSSVNLQGMAVAEMGGDVDFYPYPVAPFVDALSATQISLKWSLTPNAAADVSYEVIEHFEGAVHPVLVSIAATAVVLDWAEVPDAAADASITVVEYI